MATSNAKKTGLPFRPASSNTTMKEPTSSISSFAGARPSIFGDSKLPCHYENEPTYTLDGITLLDSGSAYPGDDIWYDALEVLPLKEFQLFPNLPLELQLYIWSLAIRPRILLVNELRRYPFRNVDHCILDICCPLPIRGTTVTCISSTLCKVPEVLHTTRQSRIEALKPYCLLTGPDVSKPIYFSPETDKLYFWSVAAMSCFSFIIKTSSSFEPSSPIDILVLQSSMFDCGESIFRPCCTAKLPRIEGAVKTFPNLRNIISFHPYFRHTRCDDYDPKERREVFEERVSDSRARWHGPSTSENSPPSVCYIDISKFNDMATEARSWKWPLEV